jgi:hypothetical protein
MVCFLVAFRISLLLGSRRSHMLSPVVYMYTKILLIHACMVVVGINRTQYHLKKAKEERVVEGLTYEASESISFFLLITPRIHSLKSRMFFGTSVDLDCVSPSSRVPCNLVEYSPSCRRNPTLGQMIGRLSRTKSTAAAAVKPCSAMRYAQTIVALRLMPMTQCT